MAKVKPRIDITVTADPSRPGVAQWLEKLRKLAESATVDITLDESGVAEQLISYRDAAAFVKAEYPDIKTPSEVAAGLWVALTYHTNLSAMYPLYCIRTGQAVEDCTCRPSEFRPSYSHGVIRRTDLATITQADLNGLGVMAKTKERLWAFLESVRD